MELDKIRTAGKLIDALENTVNRPLFQIRGDSSMKFRATVIEVKEKSIVLKMIKCGSEREEEQINSSTLIRILKRFNPNVILEFKVQYYQGDLCLVEHYFEYCAPFENKNRYLLLGNKHRE